MRLIIVDDHSLFRGALVQLFNSQLDFEVVGEAGTVKDALALVDVQHPDLVILDVGLPDGSGINAISKILKKKPDVDIVLLTIHTADENVFTAIRLGAKGVLLKSISAPALLTALHGLSRGELAVSRAVLSRYVAELRPLFLSRGGDGTGSETTLTFREVELLAELSSGDSNKEIAHRLLISENTVKGHIHNILHKLRLQNRQEATAYARRHGLARDFARKLEINSKGETQEM